MPNQDGLTPGGDGSAENKSGNSADDGANKSGNGNEGDKAGGDKGGKKDDAADEKAGQVVFGSQKELDDLIARRVSRATKKAEDDAKLTEQQRIEKERDDALALVRERDIRDDFVAKADVTPAIAQRIFKAYKDDIDIDEKTGKATNIDDVLKTAKKEMPALFSKSVVKPGGGDGGSGTGGEGGVKTGDGGMNNALRQMAGRGNAG